MPNPIKRTVFFVSDGTGLTVEALGHSLMTQFEDIEFKQIRIPFLDNVEKAQEAVARINAHLTGVTLGGGAANDIAGRAVIVHAAADDYTTQPTGNAGARVACGVITVAP